MVDLDSLAGDLASETGARLTYYLTSGLVILFLSRQFSPATYGTLFLALSVLTVGRLFSSVGLAKSAAKQLSVSLETDDGQVRHIVRSSLTYNLVTIAAVAAAVTLGAGAIAETLGAPAIEPLLVVGATYIVFATLYNYTRVLLQGFREIFHSATVYASEGVAKLVAVVALVTLGYGIYGAFVGFVVGFAVAAVLGLALVYRHLPTRGATAPLRAGLKAELRRYSVPLAVTRGAWVLDREVDVIIVGYLLAPAVVGYYAVSKQIVTFCSGLAGSVGFSLGPKFDEETVARSVDHASRTYETVLVSMLLVYLPAVAGLAILADPVVTTVFGRAYRGVVPILQVFCAGIALMSVTKLTEDILDYLGRANVRAVFKGVTSVGNVILSAVLILAVGAVGAAVATVAMQAVYASLCLYVVHTELRLRPRYLLYRGGQVAAIAAAMSAVVVSLAGYADSLLTIGGVVLCGVVVWGVLARLGGFLDPGSLPVGGVSRQGSDRS